MPSACQFAVAGGRELALSLNTLLFAGPMPSASTLTFAGPCLALGQSQTTLFAGNFSTNNQSSVTN